MRVSKKLFGPCKLAGKYKRTCHARNTVTKDGVYLLSFDPPGPQKVSERPLLQCRKFKIIAQDSSHTHSKAHDVENSPVQFTILYYQYFDNCRRKIK